MAASAIVGLLRVLLTMDTSDYETKAKRAPDPLKQLSREMHKLGRQATEVGQSLTKYVTLPLVGLGAGSIKAASEFESAFANVKKTIGQVGGSIQASNVYFADLQKFIRDTAKEIPKTTEELSAIAALGGQFGISADGMKGFTRTVADLSVAVDGITTETAAEGLAQIRNITRSSEADISRMASSLVHLGNNGASSEGQILELTKRISAAGTLAGLTTPTIMGIAAAIANVGIEAESGGTAFSRTLSEMGAAVDTGGEKLEAFAGIAGMSAEQFATTFKARPQEAIEAFIKGLGRSKDAGENLTLILGDIGVEGVRQADTLKRLALASDDVTKQIGLSNEAWQANNKHTEEAKTKYGTLKNQAVTLWNAVKDIGIELGTSLMPTLRDLIETLRPAVDQIGRLARGFAELPEPVRQTALAAALLGTFIGPAIWGVGELATKGALLVSAFRAGGILAWVPGALKAIGVAALASAPQLFAFGTAALSVITAGRAIREAIGLYQDRIEQANLAIAQNVSHQRAMADASKIAGREITNLDEALAILRKKAADSLAEQRALAEEQARLGAAAAAAAPKQKTLTDELARTRASVANLTRDQWAQLAAGDKLGLSTSELTEQFNKLYPGVKLTETAVEMATKRLDDNAKAAEKAAEAQKQFAESVKFVEVAVRGYLTLPQAVQDTGEEIRGIRESMEAVAGITPLTGTWQPFIKGVKDSKDEVAKLHHRIQLMKTLKGELGQIFQNIPQTLAQAFVSGGDLGGAAKAITSQLGSNLAKMGATALGITGPWGMAIAGAVGSLLPMVSKLWGGNAEHKKVNDMRDGFIGAAGGLHELNVKAHAAGMTLDKLLRAKTVKDYEAAVRELNAAFAEQERILEENKEAASSLFEEIMAAGSEGIPAAYRPAIEQLINLGLLTDEQAEKLRGLKDAAGPSIEAMEKALGVFKGRVESLGPAFQQAKINQTATEYVNAINTMIEGGGDLGGILFDAKEELGALVAEALKSGKTLPANLKPWIDDLVKSGNLVDENGKKITDISGIKWGDPVKTEAEKAKEGWDKILAAIEKLIEKITGPLEDGIERATRDRTVNVDVNYRERGTDGRNQGQPEGDRTGFSRGTWGRLGSYFANFSAAGTMRPLHGTQAVLNTRDALPFAIDALAGRIPEVPGLGHLAPSMGGGTEVTQSLNILPVIMGGGMSPWEIGRAAVQHLASSGLPMNESGIATAFEQVIDNYMRSYARG